MGSITIHQGIGPASPILRLQPATDAGKIHFHGRRLRNREPDASRGRAEPAIALDRGSILAVSYTHLHGKLWFIESDTRTNLTQPLASAMPSVCPDNPSYDFQGVWKGPESAELSLSLLQNGFGKVLTGRAGTWWFDMWGGWYHNPIFMDFMKTAHGMMEEDLLNPAGSAAQIAVILDDRSYAYFGLNTPVLSELVYSCLLYTSASLYR